MNTENKLLKIKKLADAMYYAAQYLTTDASGLHKAMEEYHQFIIHEHFKEEPVSEDLEEAADSYIKTYGEILGFGRQTFKAGAKWQKIKDSEEIKLIRGLLEDFDKHCDEYHEAGFKHGQEALMKDATDVTVHIDAGGYPYIPQMELYDYDKDMPLAKKGDKYKVILIKEG